MQISGAGRLIIVSFFLLGCFGLSEAQIRIYSPYSKYGVGELRTNSYNTVLMSMGGIRNAANGPNLINVYNPATYSSFDSASFVFEGGILGNMTTLKTNTISQGATYASLNHLLFGFPIAKWWRGSFGLVPYSDVGYNVVSEQTVTNIGKTSFQYKGSGGISQAYFGSAFKITDQWSIGFNMFYNFGTIDKSRTVYFPDSVATYLNARLDNKIRISDISFNTGVLYKRTLLDKYDLSVGLSFALPTKISAKREYLANTFMGGMNIPEFFTDTIAYEPAQKGNINIPLQLGFGAVLSVPDHWKVGVDFNWQNWNDYEAFGYRDSLKNSWDIAIGAEYIPEISALRSYVKKVRYRLGARYSKTPVYLRGNHINEFGISFGLGLPILRSKSVFNLGFEFGGRGTTKDDLIKENFFVFSLGISIYERWFIRRKYF